MLLAQHPSAAPTLHARRRLRPKLSLQISTAPPPPQAPPNLAAILSPTSRNTAFNRRPEDYSSCPSGSSSSSDDEAPAPVKPKRMSAFQPVTAGAGFGMPRPRSAEPRKVRFVEEPVVWIREADEDYNGADEEGEYDSDQDEFFDCPEF
ncbi:hypothetical protein EDC01DRAFT_782491 [Geopyxis carbonaria]|nr:hypothetical protein EDC01DRAFT_782491 [Geopyxis carbonaria]